MKLSAKEDRERQIKNNPDKDWSICDDLIETYNKFIICVVKIFGSLPKPKDWRSFYNNDLPLLTSIDDEVQEVAVHRSNNQNRDATPGQKAMAFAMQWPEGLQRGRGNCSQIREQLTKTQENLISKARYVLRNSPMVEGERYPRRCLSTNVHRRNMNSSQKAMAYAKNFPEGEKGGDRKTENFKSRNRDLINERDPLTKTEKNNISLARFILKHDPDKADLVRDGHPNWPPVRRH